MSFRAQFARFTGRLIFRSMLLLGRQASALPGAVALKLDPHILAYLSQGREIVCVTGSNGKTTTTALITQLLEESRSVRSNAFGANLIQGLVTTMLMSDKGESLVLEVDEATLPNVTAQLEPRVVVVTNIFRDQLDRYGSTDHVRDCIARALKDLTSDSHVVLCADDPSVASLAGETSAQCHYFAAAENELRPEEGQEEAPAAYCPHCHTRLNYDAHTIAQMGRYHCPEGDFDWPEADLLVSSQELAQATRTQRSTETELSFTQKSQGETFKVKFPLRALYNGYNAAAALLAVSALTGRQVMQLAPDLSRMQAAFGRQERWSKDGKSLCYLLIKNPAGFEEAWRLLAETQDIGALAFFINNEVGDGRDPSWVFEARIEHIQLPDYPVGIGGRCRDVLEKKLAPCFKEPLQKAEQDAALVERLFELCPPGKTLYLLPNYTAMMELRAALAPAFHMDARVR